MIITTDLKDYRIPEITVRMYVKEIDAMYSREPVTNTFEMGELLCRQFRDLDREQIIVMNLDSQGRPISYYVAGIGGTNAVHFPITNVFKTAIIQNAVSIVLCHNHPGGRLVPSSEDLDATKECVRVGELLGIRLLDHFIISPDDYYSMRERNPELFHYNNKGGII